MDAQTLALLEQAGFRSVTVGEFLGLTPEEEALAELKARLNGLLRKTRKARGWTQAQLATRLKTRQQVVARAENGHRSVSMDFLMEALLALGVSLREISSVTCEGAAFLEAQDEAVARRCPALELVSLAESVVHREAAQNMAPPPVLQIIAGGPKFRAVPVQIQDQLSSRTGSTG